MKIYRPDTRVIEISDLAAEIACSLKNTHLLSNEYLDVYQFDDMTEKQKSIFLIEEVAIKIDDILQSQNGVTSD